jgi:H+-translocating NAD(P) transhydrogenase subunit alpha
LYASNVSAFLKLIVQNGEIKINRDDQIIQETLVTHDGQVVNTRVRELLENAEAQAVRS